MITASKTDLAFPILALLLLGLLLLVTRTPK